ncbi:CD99 molecule isoform X2 [Corythoichthys intestinalis]|uniref:CD99 molecule isoform X2 n=1 Tax=Corythoichthys intestinalis TaxID=161448 RepID=UPI0025A5BF1C|nr:CD99 molecule isoform X2 [Corythoichthys intestinalis]
MKFYLLPAVLLLVTEALTQDGFDLMDALDDIDPTPPKPKENPKAPVNPDDDDRLSLFDALGPDDPEPAKPKNPKPKPGDSGGFELDLEDALNPDPNSKPDKPAVNPRRPSGGGGHFDDNDLLDVSDGNYRPEGGRAGSSGYDEGGADQPQDPDLWLQILKMLNFNMPEEILMWMSNIKKTLIPLLERALELMQAIP